MEPNPNNGGGGGGGGGYQQLSAREIDILASSDSSDSDYACSGGGGSAAGIRIGIPNPHTNTNTNAISSCFAGPSTAAEPNARQHHSNNTFFDSVAAAAAAVGRPAVPHPPGQGPPSSASRLAPTERVGKKRSRASRRAPTTVLTTDTTNFRAMVQEFTGIPPAPFGSSSSSSTSGRRAFDLNPYVLRPFAHRTASGSTGFFGGAGAGGLGAAQPAPAPSMIQSILQQARAEPVRVPSVVAGPQMMGPGERRWPVEGAERGGENGRMVASWISSSSDQSLDKLVL